MNTGRAVDETCNRNKLTTFSIDSVYCIIRLGVIVIGNSNSNSKDYRKQCNSNSNIIEIFGEKE